MKSAPLPRRRFRQPVEPKEPSAPCRDRNGTTIVELLISGVLLTVAIGGLLTTSNAIAKQVGASRRQMLAAGVAQARIDSLASISCTALGGSGLTSGTRTTRGVTEAWTVTSSTNARQIVLTLTVAPSQKRYSYTSIVPCV